MTINTIIQARMGSTRLPGKVLKQLSGKPIIQHIIERVRDVKEVAQIIVATSDQTEDDSLVEYISGLDDVFCFRGSELNVLNRFYHAYKEFPSDMVIRVTGDCPLIDPPLLRRLITLLIESNSRYATTEGFPLGVSAEIFTNELLEEAYSCADRPYEFEHVTPYMYTRQESIVKLLSEEDLSGVRLTVDTAEDYLLVDTIYHEFSNQHFSLCSLSIKFYFFELWDTW